MTDFRLGKVKTEHRQMETGQWEDPLRYLKKAAGISDNKGENACNFQR